MKKILGIFIVLVSVLLFKNNVYAYYEYEVGDLIKYKDEDYYVIKNSDINMDYVTLLKAEPLTADEINKYNGGEFISSNGELPFSMACDSGGDVVNCYNDYNDSLIKITLENWMNDKLNANDLKKIDGYKVRLMKIDEFVSYLFVDTALDVSGRGYYIVSNETPTWVYNSQYSYWTMDNFHDDSNKVVIVNHDGRIYEAYARDEDYVLRPVINLKKCSIDETSDMCTCTKQYKNEIVTKYKGYTKGDTVEYNGETLEVLKDSDEDDSYVYISHLMPEYRSDNKVQYYNSNTCIDDNNKTGCTNNYAVSIIKKIIDNWLKYEINEDDFVEVDNYKARLITGDELLQKLAFEYKDHTDFAGYYITTDTPTWVLECTNNIKYWTMETYLDSNYFVYQFNGDKYVYPSSVFNYGQIIPVINIKKSVIGEKALYNIGDEVEYNGEKYHVIDESDTDKNYVTLWKCGIIKNNIVNKCDLAGGCWQEEIQVENGCAEDDLNPNSSKVAGDNKTVNVDNTLKKISFVFLIISLILMIVGVIIFYYNYYKINKIRK